jgi:RHS repeat-associated protein
VWRDPALPAFLNDAAPELGAAQAFWSPRALRIQAEKSLPRARIFHHQDHLSSTAALTDTTGKLLEERTYHPYGVLRNIHRPKAAPAGSSPYDFTDKERDAESGLIAMGLRSYFGVAGVFLSPDPRYTEVAALASGSDADKQSFSAFLAAPQMGNLYAYALRNPLKLVDPSGLDVTFAKELSNDKLVAEARALLGKTQEGQRILKSIDARGAVVHFDAAPRTWILQGVSSDGKPILAERLGWMNINPGAGPRKGAVSMEGIRATYSSKEELVRYTAWVIYHELRHAEASFMEEGAYYGAGAGSRAHSPDEWPTGGSQQKVHQMLDKYDIPNADPHQKEFEREIGLWTMHEGKEIRIEYAEITLDLSGK